MGDTSSVTTMEEMFLKAKEFNGNLSSWDTSSVENMRYMLAATQRFNRNLSSWDISSVADMRYMFGSAHQFNQELCWNIPSTVKTFQMFVYSGGRIGCN